MGAIQFIEKNKEMFFRWLYETEPNQFPKVCEFAADVLGCWLYVHFPNEKIQIQSGTYDGWGHSWIEVNGIIVDFTITQFFGGLCPNQDNNLTAHEFYERYFLKYIPSPFIKRELIQNYKVEERLFGCKLDKAKWHSLQGSNFLQYVKSVRDEKIKNRLYTILKKEDQSFVFVINLICFNALIKITIKKMDNQTQIVTEGGHYEQTEFAKK
ncbi:hypothetical protein NDS46_30245 (plasmid) [Paenibacillus thiaminolyticus]|uniref:hypothetical protein n=1 Tax=Paenibacillus thiaminolyticus TaxID=49283 RepID=UPI0023300666|nr:hypothetical protein [Paenibacillus thiaminolyticus]WCF11629.1 hypothetical protein NDS46_30245 [Paenibacillus thiaminolyticus]